MLDATLPEPFFERNPDGSRKEGGTGLGFFEATADLSDTLTRI